MRFGAPALEFHLRSSASQHDGQRYQVIQRICREPCTPCRPRLLRAWLTPAYWLARYLALLVRMAKYGPDLGRPHTRATGDGLFEVRAKAGEGIGRAFYCTLVGRRIVVLHGFIKKTDKTPANELKIARNRLKELKP